MEMFKYIGDTDPMLRDELIYETYMHFCENKLLSDKCMEYLFESCQDSNHLFLELGSQDGDSVYIRSFSILLLVGLVECNLSNHFLKDESILKLYNNICKYYQCELNLNGYDEKRDGLIQWHMVLIC